MKLATTTGDFARYTKTTSEAVAAFENTGFKHLDYSFYSVIYDGSPFLEDEWQREVEEAGNTAACLGFDFVQAHSPNYNPLDEKSDGVIGMKALNRSIEACKMLGIKNIVVHPGYSEKFIYTSGKDGFFAENESFFKNAILTAEKYDVTLCIENSAEQNMGRNYFFMTGSEMAEFVERINHPLLKCCFDVGHANMRQTSIYNDIVDIGNHLKTVHIQDNFGDCDEHIAPMFGTLDVDAVMQALIKINYGGYFTFEADNMLWTAKWPHAKKEDPFAESRRLAMPPLELKIEAEKLLYKIGEYILKQYDSFEE